MNIIVCIFRNSLKNSSISLFDTQLIFSECSFIFLCFLFCFFSKSSINQPLPIQQKFVFFSEICLIFQKMIILKVWHKKCAPEDLPDIFVEAFLFLCLLHHDMNLDIQFLLILISFLWTLELYIQIYWLL